MPDYGHQLQFATFPEPLAHPATSAVELAVLSESWGYDLVAFQDHPYIGGYLDVWTLMSWVAARTTRIKVAANVINVGMRSAALTAKAAATIDQLSAARFELGLGAGFRWDDMAAMGARRLSFGEGVYALAEAIDVIRGCWNTTEADALHIPGTYHRITRLDRGPAPAHTIPIWVGAYKPRMLRLVGHHADGWTAALGRLQTRQQWQSGSAIIDHSAAEAGRSPADIRRIAGITGEFSTRAQGFLRGPASQWVAELLPSVLEDGVSTFLVATDHRYTLQKLAEEVIPALREAPTSERSRSASKPATP